VKNLLLGLSLFLVLLGLPAISAAGAALSKVEQLGKSIFFDAALSAPSGQSCSTCHHPDAGWTGLDSEINAGTAVYPGAVKSRFGNRKPPSAAYATPSSALYFDAEEEIFVGGNFWDGRATGWLLGKPAAEQAQGPFLNPLEHNLGDAATVVAKVCASAYTDQFREVYGNDICGNTVNAYNAIGQAVFAYEDSAEVNAYSSKYDHYLKDPHRYPLTAQEMHGLELFEDEERGQCAECHPSRPDEAGRPPLFTDFTFDNLGLPRNPDNPFYAMAEEYNPDGPAWVDPGLGGFLQTVPRFARYSRDNHGLHKVPTLRNVDKRPKADFVKAFGHNGVFRSLKEIVHFYNVRDKLPACDEVDAARPAQNCWHRPEVAMNINREELGDLGLSDEEEWAIVAFLKTLSDGWQPPSKDSEF
jgi:cytochrome c peroxidase